MPNVTITTDKLTVDVPHGYPLIDLGEAHDTSILFGCRDGSCGACLVRFTKGEQNVSPPTPEERSFLDDMAAEKNERLACLCKVFGDVTIEVSE